MSKLNKGLFSSKDQTWETPIDFFNKLDSIFKFELDVAASDDNHKCDKYYTEETDGLAQDWEGVCWMNPPYGRHQIKWIEKASEEADSQSCPSLPGAADGRGRCRPERPWEETTEKR